jgi:hypothetical protein
MASIFGVVIAGSFIEMGVSRILPWVKKTHYTIGDRNRGIADWIDLN